MYSAAASSTPQRAGNPSMNTATQRPRDASAASGMPPVPSFHLFDQMKAEFESVVEQLRLSNRAERELERKVQSQVAEMKLIHQTVAALEASHRRISRRYDEEVAQLRSVTAAAAAKQQEMANSQRLRTTQGSEPSIASKNSAASGPSSQNSSSISIRAGSTASSSHHPPPLPPVQHMHHSDRVPGDMERLDRVTPPPLGARQLPAFGSPPPPAKKHKPIAQPITIANNGSEGRHSTVHVETAGHASIVDDQARGPLPRVRCESNSPEQPIPSSSTSSAASSTKKKNSTESSSSKAAAEADASESSASARHQSSKTSKTSPLNWKCVYPSKSAGSSTQHHEPDRPAAEMLHAIDHQSAVCVVRFASDGAMVASGCHKSAQVFDVKTGERTFTIPYPSAGSDASSAGGVNEAAADDAYVRAVCFSPDCTKLVVGMPVDQSIRTWDIASSEEGVAMTGHDAGIYALEYMGDLIVSGSGDRTVRLWDARSGRCKKVFGSEKNSGGPTDGVTSVALSPGGGRLLAAGSLDKIVRVWDTETGQLLDRLDAHSDSVYSIAFSPDGRQLVSGAFDRTIMLWDVGAQGRASSRPRMVFQGHRELVLSVAYTPDGRWLMSGSKDRSVLFWDPRSSRSVLTLTGHRNSVIGVAASPVSPHFATASGDGYGAIWSYRCESL